MFFSAMEKNNIKGLSGRKLTECLTKTNIGTNQRQKNLAITTRESGIYADTRILFNILK